ncbi:MAG: sigma-70 family RNA polymerase sigma factor [Bacteroidota bacterium]
METARKDSDLIADLLAGGKRELGALGRLYSLFLPEIVRYIIRNQGSEEDAKDVFQDALIAFSEQIRGGSFRKESSIKSYLWAICRNMWLNQLKRRKHAQAYVAAQENADVPPVKAPDRLFLENEQDQQIMSLFGRVGEKCRELLRLRIYYHFSMQEIAVQLGYKNAQNAKNKHFKCMKSLRTMVAENADLRKSIREMI